MKKKHMIWREFCGLDDKDAFNEINRLAAERDEYKRKLDAILDLLEPDNMAKKYVDGCEVTTKAWDTASIVYARAVAIAEGQP